MDPLQAAKKAFDLIDNNSLGQAEVVVENARKKHPSHHALLAAEAFLYLRNGKTEKAREAATDLALLQDCTEPVAIDAVAHVLQQVGAFQPLAVMYQRVATLLPDSVNVQENLFNTLLRVGSYSDAQKVALALHKKHNASEPKYQTWAVMAMLAQVPLGASDHLLLKLTAKLMETSVLTPKGTLTPELCKTYVDVLVQQRRLPEALAFLQSAVGARVGLEERRLSLLRHVLVEQQRCGAAAAVARHLWRLGVDNWDAFEWYLDGIGLSDEADAESSLVLEPSQPGGCSTTISLRHDSSYDKAFSLVGDMQRSELTENHKKMKRGPFLAHLELLKRSGRTDELPAAVVEHCKWFFTKPVCFMDVVTYVHADAAARDAAVAWCTQTLPTLDNGSLTYHQLRMLEMRISQTQYTVANPRSDEDAQESVRLCVELYTAALPLSQSLAWSEEGLCDGYIHCALTIAVKQYTTTKQHEWLLAALRVVYATQRTLNNPSWLMIAVQCQRLLGIVDTKFTRQLDFKSVQFDSVRTLGFSPVVEGGAISDSEQWSREGFKFYASLGKDTSALRVKVFKFFTMTMWNDLLRFEAKLASSIARVETLAHFALTNVRQCQTQKYLFSHCEALTTEVGDALRLCMTSDLQNNEDTLVFRATLAEYVHSDSAHAVQRAMVGGCDMQSRRKAVVDQLLLFAVVHDHALRESARLAKAAAPKPRKGEKEIQGQQQLAVRLLLTEESFEKQLFNASWPQLLQPIMPQLVDTLRTGGATAGQWTSSLQELTERFTTSVLDAADATALQKALLPSTYALSAVMIAAGPSAVPVAKLATTLQPLLVAVKAKLELWASSSEQLQTSNPLLSTAAELLPLQRAKLQQLQQVVEDLAADCTAGSKRK